MALISIVIGIVIGALIVFFLARNNDRTEKVILAQNMYYRDEVIKALVKYIGQKEGDVDKTSLCIPHCFFVTNEDYTTLLAHTKDGITINLNPNN